MQQRPLPDPDQSHSPCWEGRLLPVGPVHLVWPPVLLRETCLHPPGKRKGQSPEGGVDWYLDKVREEAELKEEDLHA